MKNGQTSEELYRKSYEEICNENKKVIIGFDCACCVGTISILFFGRCAFNTSDIVLGKVFFGLFATSGILTALTYFNRYQIFKQIEKDAQNAASTSCAELEDKQVGQERAFALRDYIADVAYEGFEDDLVALDSLIGELSIYEDASYVSNINYEVNKLAQKAYDKALGLYGIGR